LVKFARLTPSEPECSTALGDAEQIIERTVPPPLPVGALDAPPPEQSPSEEEQDG
jgi:hypothetical protein